MAQSVLNCVDSMLLLAAEFLDYFSIRSVLLEIKAQTWFSERKREANLTHEREGEAVR